MNALTALLPEAEPEQQKKQFGRLAIRFALAAAVAWLIAKGFAWRQITAGLASVQFIYLLPVVLAVTPASIVLRSLRWRCMLVEGDFVPLRAYIRAYVVGFLANSLLLGKLGDLVKARMIVCPGLSYAGSIASAILDRLLEGIALTIVLGVSLIFADLPIWTRQMAGMVSLGCLAVLLWLGVAYWKREAFVLRLRGALGFINPAARDRVALALRHFLEGLEPLTHRARVFAALGYSMTVWTLEIVAVMTFMKAFSIPAPHFLAAILILAALNFGTLVPISPGSIGVYQLLCVFALSVWNVNRELAFSFGLVMQAVLFVPVYLAGAAAFLFGDNRKAHEVGLS